MKLLSLLFLVTMVASIEYYDSEIDKLNIESIVNCPEKMQRFTGCLIDRSCCDDIASRIKKTLPEVILTLCERCTPKQRHIAKRHIETLKSEYPEDYELYKKKYGFQDSDIDAFLKALACD